MEKKKNDCYKCPYREQLSHTHHSKCNIMGSTLPLDSAQKAMLDTQTSILVVTGVLQSITSTDDNSVLLSFNEHGVNNGWCSWPINFDPVWVDCRFPIPAAQSESEKTQDDGI
jgi:hypothetical protein